ncbi:MAG: hydrogenase maturation protease [Calditrichaeota bacterium]|nr:hydrogenase maturation protease [Calditrichota bacterium]
MKTLILGLGNPVLGDDSIGIRLVSDLENRFRKNKNITCKTSSQSGLYLLDLLINYDRVIFIDSVIDAKFPVGHIQLLPVHQEALQIRGCSPHYIGIQSVLAIGRKMNLNMPRRLFVIGIVIHDGMHISEHLSPELKENYPTAHDKTLGLIRTILAGKELQVTSDE